MKITKRPGLSPLLYYCALIVPMLIVFNVSVYVGFTASMESKKMLLLALITGNLFWFIVSFKIESIWIDRFICIMKQHPRKEMLRAYTAKGKKYEDKDVVLVEYHCELCDATILENKLYKDIK